MFVQIALRELTRRMQDLRSAATAMLGAFPMIAGLTVSRAVLACTVASAIPLAPNVKPGFSLPRVQEPVSIALQASTLPYARQRAHRVLRAPYRLLARRSAILALPGSIRAAFQYL